MWRDIEVVITGLTRNQFAGNRTRVRIPPTPPKEKPHPCGVAFLFGMVFDGGIRKAALGNMPVACCNRRGFSAEKRIPPSPPKGKPHPCGVAFLLAKIFRRKPSCIYLKT